VILSSAQALLWDEDRGEYVLHRVGDDLMGGRLVELDGDHVVIDRGETREVLEISAPPQTRVAGRRQPKRMPAMIISAVSDGPDGAGARAASAPMAAAAAAGPSTAATTVAAAPPGPLPTAVDPTVPVAASAPLAPQAVAAATANTPAASLPNGTVAAPSSATSAAPVAAVAATPSSSPSTFAASTATTPTAIAAPTATTPAPTIAAPPAAPPTSAAIVASASPSAVAAVPERPVTTAAPAAAPTAQAFSAVVIARAELDRELGDFASLSQQLQVATLPEGGFRLVQVRSGSFFERIGLRTNDVVLRVDGRPINGVDDASAAYAWLRVTNKFTVDVLRDGRAITLHYAIAPSTVTASAGG
jgi:hypothetical protein